MKIDVICVGGIEEVEKALAVIERKFNSMDDLFKARPHKPKDPKAILRIRAGQSIKYIATQRGHASVKITLDTYGHLFDDQDFNRLQVGLLETTFNAPVRNPLEKSPKNAKKGSAALANPL